MSDRIPEAPVVDVPAVSASGPWRPEGRAAPSNPFAAALVWIWSAALCLGVVLIVTSKNVESFGVLLWGLGFVAIGLVALFVYLGAKAVIWALPGRSS